MAHVSKHEVLEKWVYDYLLKRPEAVSTTPFGPDVEVMKVCDKMFATYARNDQGVVNINLKCDPAEALMLRDLFSGVLPGYHMNKKHWNTVLIDGSVPENEIERMIDRSYGLVVKKLKQSERRSLELRYGIEALYR